MVRNGRLGDGFAFYRKLNSSNNGSAILEGCGIFYRIVHRIYRYIFRAKSIVLPCTSVSCVVRNSRLGDGFTLYRELNSFNNGITIHEDCRVFNKLPFCIEIDVTCSTNSDFAYFVSKSCIGIPTKETVTIFACIRKCKRLIFYIVSCRIAISRTIYVMIGNIIADHTPFCRERNISCASFRNLSYLFLSVVPSLEHITGL